jgi:uncharacterized membrane protein
VLLKQPCSVEGDGNVGADYGQYQKASAVADPRLALAAVVAGALTFLLTRGLPDQLNLLLAFDVTTVVYVVLFCVLMWRASPEKAAEMSRRHEPRGLLMLLGVIVVSVVSLVGVAAMLNQPTHRPR